MNAYCECLWRHHKLSTGILQSPVLHVVWILKEITWRGLWPVKLQQLTEKNPQPSGSFCKKNGHFPIILSTDCPFRTFAKRIGQFFQLLTRNSSHPMSACWKPVTCLAWVRIMEPSLHRLTRLFLSTNLKLFAGLQISILCSLLTQATFQPWIPLNLNPTLCAVGHCWAFPLLSQCHALRKMNAAFVAALSEHHL